MNKYIFYALMLSSITSVYSKIVYTFDVNILVREETALRLAEADNILNIYEPSIEQAKEMLAIKLISEANEVRDAKDDKEELKKELADVLEVYYALLEIHDLSHSEIEEVRAQRKKVRGGYKKKTYATTWIISDETEKSRFWVEYCLARPEKYPLLDVKTEETYHE